MQRRRDCVAIIERANVARVPKGAAAKARRKAHLDGVCLPPVQCAWAPPPDDNWVFGPDPDNDNIYQCVPQVCHVPLPHAHVTLDLECVM
jgi:hypothetical protein